LTLLPKRGNQLAVGQQHYEIDAQDVLDLQVGVLVTQNPG
jgi:hypothetical protein